MANHFGRIESTMQVHFWKEGQAAVSGQILGVRSNVNYLMNTRGAASDFDDWDMPGRGFRDPLPCFKKVSGLV